MPRPIIYVLAIMTVLTLVPLAYFARARQTDSAGTRLQVVFDMDAQPRFRAQAESDFFADGRAARPPVPGTVEYDRPPASPSFAAGHIDSVWVVSSPLPVTPELLARGRDRFDIYCAACHGLAGQGDGPVHARAVARNEGNWTPPANLTGQTTSERPIGEIFSIITHGVRNMPANASLMPAADRWAVATYVRALQRAANGTMDDVPADARPALR